MGSFRDRQVDPALLLVEGILARVQSSTVYDNFRGSRIAVKDHRGGLRADNVPCGPVLSNGAYAGNRL